VQLALQVSDLKTAAEIATALHGRVRAAIGSPHANFVLQKIIEVLPMELTAFIAEELVNSGTEAACHRYGCRVICRLIEHCLPEPVTVALVNEIIVQADKTCQHLFGHHVLETLLEHGLPEQQHKVALALHGNLHQNAKNRNAGHVVEKALAYCCRADQEILAAELLSKPESIGELAQSQLGSYVVKELVKLPEEHGHMALAQLRAVETQVMTTKYGKRLLDLL